MKHIKVHPIKELEERLAPQATCNEAGDNQSPNPTSSVNTNSSTEGTTGGGFAVW